MATVRRDKLMRMAKAGKLLAVASYHFDDMMGESRGDHSKDPMPVVIREHGKHYQDGTYAVFESDFKSSSGTAYTSGDHYVLIVHSNSNHEFVEHDVFFLKLGEKLGAEAFRAGKDSASSLDPAMSEALAKFKEKFPGSSTPLIKGWAQGWAKANFA